MNERPLDSHGGSGEVVLVTGSSGMIGGGVCRRLAGEFRVVGLDRPGQRELGRLIHGESRRTHSISKELAKAGAWSQERVAAALPMVDEPFIRPWMIDLADDHYELDVARAADLLGWRPSHALRATMPVMIAKLKDDPSHWFRENGLVEPNHT